MSARRESRAEQAFDPTCFTTDNMPPPFTIITSTRCFTPCLSEHPTTEDGIARRDDSVIAAHAATQVVCERGADGGRVEGRVSRRGKSAVRVRCVCKMKGT